LSLPSKSLKTLAETVNRPTNARLSRIKTIPDAGVRPAGRETTKQSTTKSRESRFVLSHLVTAGHERKHKAYGEEPQQNHRWNPNGQVHSTYSLEKNKVLDCAQIASTAGIEGPISRFTGFGSR
jgi:hypothetical protein